MKYQNPIIPGFHPDPSICKKDNDYYLVTSSFEYFPGVPIFSSTDLINWKQIGSCLTRQSQLDLTGVKCSQGIYAPTIRCHNDRFYMITTCLINGKTRNFYVTATNPAGDWSDPVDIDIRGIDPSMYFENGRTYIQYSDYDDGISTIRQVEIELDSGRLLCQPKTISRGCGGRDVEAPHIFKRGSCYYLLLAEGGTREGHMVTLSRSESIWGPFRPCPHNPILSNKDSSKEPIQSVGHGDLVEDGKGEPWLVCLGTRPYKHRTVMGRETMLSPCYWDDDGWLHSKLGYLPMDVETELNVIQKRETDFSLDVSMKQLPNGIISPRHDISKHISFSEDAIEITGTDYSLDSIVSPVFLALRQRDYAFELTAAFQFDPENAEQEAGIALLGDNEHHTDLLVTSNNEVKSLLLRKRVGDILDEKFFDLPMGNDPVNLKICGSKEKYFFFLNNDNNEWVEIGWTYTKHFATECTFSQFTGVVAGFHVKGPKPARLTKLNYSPIDNDYLNPVTKKDGMISLI